METVDGTPKDTGAFPVLTLTCLLWQVICRSSLPPGPTSQIRALVISQLDPTYLSCISVFQSAKYSPARTIFIACPSVHVALLFRNPSAISHPYFLIFGLQFLNDLWTCHWLILTKLVYSSGNANKFSRELCIEKNQPF